MTIAYPLALPGRQIKRLTFRPRSVVGVSESPFTLEQQIYAHPGDAWAVDVELAPMKREDAEPWLAWLLALNGREGTFLLGDPRGAVPLGTWAAPILVHGASQTGRTLNIDGAVPFATAKAGDWFQIGSTYLHKVTQDLVFDSGGEGTLCFWPRLRATPADNDALTLLSAKGLFRLAQNDNNWSIDRVSYGLNFSCVEAR